MCKNPDIKVAHSKKEKTLVTMYLTKREIIAILKEKTKKLLIVFLTNPCASFLNEWLMRE